MSALRERQPINVTGCEASLGDNKSKIIALEERKKNLYNEVKAMGFLKEPYFTANQLNILELRGYPREGPLIPYRTLKRDGVLGKKTFQSACDSETRALRKMGKITRKNVLNWQGGMPKGLTMSPDEERYIQENQNLSVEQIAKDLGHVHGTITRWRDLLLLPRTKVGRRRES